MGHDPSIPDHVTSNREATLRAGTAQLSFLRRLTRSMLQWWDLLTRRQTADWWIWVRALNSPIILVAVTGLAVAWFSRPTGVDMPESGTPSGPLEWQAQGSRASGLPTSGAQLSGSTLFGAAGKSRARPTSEHNVTLAELSKGLQLQAIIGGNNPRAVIFNSETNQTHQVSAGQFIGDIEVRGIGTTTVELGWKDETIQLSL